MGAESQTREILHLLPLEVNFLFQIIWITSIKQQVLMKNKDGEAKDFLQLEFDDIDLIMFTITDLRLEKRKEQVHMVIYLKRKIQTELLTTYLPTLLLLAISYATIYFKPIFFEACLTVGCDNFKLVLASGQKSSNILLALAKHVLLAFNNKV